MALGLFDRLARWQALRGYRGRLGSLLVGRYGRQRCYTPPQVLTTIKLYGLNERFAPYACAMFCSERAYSEFVAKHVSRSETVEPLTNSDVPLWVGTHWDDWPTHQQVVADLGQHDASDHFQHHLADFGHHGLDHGNHGSDGGHHGGSHDGGAGGGEN